MNAAGKICSTHGSNEKFAQNTSKVKKEKKKVNLSL
jgi:hypothetical protein